MNFGIPKINMKKDRIISKIKLDFKTQLESPKSI